MNGTKYLGALYLALAAGIWGGMYVVSKIVLASVEPLALVWLRYVIGLVVLVGVGIATRQRWRIRPRDVFLIVAIGLVGYGVSIWAQFRGTALSTAQMGAMVTSATPAFMVVFARMILGERISGRRVAAVVIATVGVLLVVGVGRLTAQDRLGGLVLLLAAVTWALMSVLIKRLPTEYSALLVTTYGIGVAAVTMTPAALSEMPPWHLILARPELWVGTLYLGIVSTAGAFFLWSRGLQLTDAASGGLLFFFQPLVGTVLGWLVLDEPVGVPFIVGAVLIVIGVLLTMRPQDPAPPRAQIAEP